MSTGLADVFADMAADQLEDMGKSQKNFEEKLASQNAAVDESVQKIISRIGGGRHKPQGPQYSEEVKSIANTLTAFPKLVPVINAVIVKFTKALDDKFNEMAEEYTGPELKP